VNFRPYKPPAPVVVSFIPGIEAWARKHGIVVVPPPTTGMVVNCGAVGCFCGGIITRLKRTCSRCLHPSHPFSDFQRRSLLLGLRTPLPVHLSLSRMPKRRPVCPEPSH
jgi:hypothetical protein